MSDPLSTIPSSWTPEIPGDRTLTELNGVLARGCPAEIRKETWEYTTWTQDIWNFLAWHIGNGILSNQKHSIGTALRTYFYCYSDAPTQNDARTAIVSRTTALADCVLTVTIVRQLQHPMRRTWERWTLTALFKDDPSSARVDGAVGALASLLGIVGTGVVNVASGILSGVASLIPIFDEAIAIRVARHTADGGMVWVNSGSPSSSLEFGPVQLPPEICEALTPALATPLTTPVDPGD